MTARIVLDGGAYASSSIAVCLNAASTGAGPYECRTPTSTATSSTPTTRPAGRCAGSGRCRCASPTRRRWTGSRPRSGVAPVELRTLNAMATGTVMPTGQVMDGPAPVAELLERVEAMPLPPRPGDGDLRGLPGGVSNTTHGEGVRRGVGYAVGFKNVGFSGGFDDYSTARVRLSVAGGEPQVEVHTAACEVGQGGVTVQAQIARDGAGSGARDRAARRHPGRERRARVGVAPDLVHGRRGEGCLRGGARALLQMVVERLGRRASRSLGTARSPPRAMARDRARGADRRRPGRGDARVPAAPDIAARPERPGGRSHGVRVRRPPRGGRRGRGARAREGRGDRHRAGRGAGDEPDRGRGPDRRRHRPGTRARADGGDPDRRTAASETPPSPIT